MLEHLDVDFIFLSRKGFFERLILPNIKELNIGNHFGDPIPRLIPMILRSQTPSLLQKLSIYTQFHRPGNLSLLLALTPQLQELNIWMPDSLDLCNLTIRSGARVLVPQLRSLRFVTDTTVGIEHYINTLAASRCELATDPEYTRFSKNTTPVIQPLSHFLIILRDGGNRFGERENLDDSASAFAFDDNQSTLHFLRLCREAIIEAMPWIGNVYVKPQKMAYTTKRLAQLDAIFTALANWKIDHANYLYVRIATYMSMVLTDPLNYSGPILHIALHFFCRQPPYLVPGGKRYRFQLRAAELLEKWSACLLEDLQHRHWAVGDDHSVKYVSNNDSAFNPVVST